MNIESRDVNDGTLSELGDVLRVRLAAIDASSEILATSDDSLTLAFVSERSGEFLRRLIEVPDVSFRKPAIDSAGLVGCVTEAGSSFAIAPTLLSEGITDDGNKILSCNSAGEVGEVVWRPTGLTEEMMKSARIVTDDIQGDFLEITFNGEGAMLFENVTSELVGFPIGVFLGDALISAPNVQASISGGSAAITGLSGDELALANAVIAGGKLPSGVTIQSIESQ